MVRGKSMYDKIWEQHLVYDDGKSVPLLYVDRHFIHEVTSPQAFEGLRLSGRKFRRPDLSFATMDHNVSTRLRDWNVAEKTSRHQMETLARNCKEFGVELYDIANPNNGIIHVIGPELGLTLPGMTIVCGDSHTSTHGAFGALAFGIGTSEVEHVMATQALCQSKSQNMNVKISGQLSFGVEAKDIILALIGKIGTRGGQGSVIEYTGEAISSLSMEGRMTICNMSIEAGARAGLIAPDQITYDYLVGRKYAPAISNQKTYDMALEHWQSLCSDSNAFYDSLVELDASSIEPQVTWGTNPSQVSPISGNVPIPEDVENQVEREALSRSLEYMGIAGGTAIQDIQINKVFIGSCTNARIEDLRRAAKIAKGRKVSSKVEAIVVPGSAEIRKQAESEGLHKVFLESGFEWRFAGCSMCLAMNDDVLQPKDRCASTSNRNFEGRQGRGGRTHLVSPAMASAAAVTGHFIDVREFTEFL